MLAFSRHSHYYICIETDSMLYTCNNYLIAFTMHYHLQPQEVQIRSVRHGLYPDCLQDMLYQDSSDLASSRRLYGRYSIRVPCLARISQASRNGKKYSRVATEALLLLYQQQRSVASECFCHQENVLQKAL